MISLSFNIHGELIADLSKIPVRLRQRIAVRMEELVEELYAKLVATPAIAALETKTGWNIFEHGVESQGSAIIGYVSPIKKGDWYYIYPKKQFLRFIGRSGQIVFAKQVFHPPFPIDRYMSETFEEMVPVIEAGLELAVTEALQ